MVREVPDERVGGPFGTWRNGPRGWPPSGIPPQRSVAGCAYCVFAFGDAGALAERMQKVLAEGRAALPRPPAFDAVLETVRPDSVLDQYMSAYRDAIAMRASQAIKAG